MFKPRKFRIQRRYSRYKGDESMAAILTRPCVAPALPEAPAQRSLFDDLPDETFVLMNEVLAREPGFHQVNAVNQKKGECSR